MLIINDDTVEIPNRQLTGRPGRTCYTRRVNKKWRKRYGTYLKPVIADGMCIRYGDKVMVNSRTAKALADSAIRAQVDVMFRQQARIWFSTNTHFPELGGWRRGYGVYPPASIA